MNIAQLHERVKNLSDPQLVEMSQRGDTTASLALMELNARNDMREASIQPMGEPPTIAEQEASKAMQGIGAPPIDPNMITPEMLGGIGSPDMMPQPQPMGSGVGQLSAPMMMAGGGLVELAEGGLTDAEIAKQIAEQEELIKRNIGKGVDSTGRISSTGQGPGLESRWDQFSDWAGGIGSGVADWAGENPFEAGLTGASTALMAAPDWRLRGIGAILGKATKLGKKVPAALRKLYTKKVPGTFLGETPRRVSGRRIGTTLGASYVGGKGAGAIYDLLTDPVAAPEQPVMAATPSKADLLVKQKEADEYLKAQKAAADKLAKAVEGEGKGTPDPKKGGLAGFLAGIDPADFVGGLAAGAQLYSGATAGEAAEKGLAATMEGQKVRAAREAAEVDAAYKQRALDLEEMQINRVYDAAVQKLGIKQSDILKEKADFFEKRQDEFLRRAAALAEREGLDATQADLYDIAQDIGFKEFQKLFVSTFGDARLGSRLDEIRAEIRNRTE